MGEVYNAFATIGRVDSYVTLICCCLVGCSIVGYAFWITTQDEKAAKNRWPFLGIMTSIALCLCLCGVIYVFAAKRSKHVAAFGGFMALT